MMRVVTSGFVTLDRVSEDPGGVEDSPIGGWAFGYERGPEGDRYKLDDLRRLGRDRLHRTRSKWCDSDLERGDLNE
jgi:hypothetical protein